jgi:sodium/potassium-transporting ATPase subunit alpha
LIRDANPSEQNPTTASDNITVYLKGAPDRVIDRCSHVLINGVAKPLDSLARQRYDMANDKFAKNGERVLGFARIHLDPEHFKKNPAFDFGTDNWKSWKDVKVRDPNINGWFPMWGLTLCGLVSLNDPPRHMVDMSVLKC